MGTIRRVVTILAGHREGLEAFAHVWLIAWTCMTVAVGLVFIAAVFMAMEPTP